MLWIEVPCIWYGGMTVSGINISRPDHVTKDLQIAIDKLVCEA